MPQAIVQQILSPENLWIAIIVIALWTLPWKAWALWRAAHRDDKWWFVAIFLINSLAILEILYIFIFSKRKETEP